MCSRNNSMNYSSYEGYGYNSGMREGYGNIGNAYGGQVRENFSQRESPASYGGSKFRNNYQGIRGGNRAGRGYGGDDGGDAPGMRNVTTITGRLFQQNGMNLGTPYTFVMIQSSGCPHCQMAKPDFQLLANMLGNDPVITLATVQADAERDLYMTLNKMLKMQGVPAYFLFKDGRLVAEYTGNRTQRDMVEFLQKMVR